MSDKKATGKFMKAYEEKEELKASESYQISEQLKSASDTASNLNVGLDGLKIKLKQAMRQLANTNAICTEKESLWNPLIVNYSLQRA